MSQKLASSFDLCVLCSGLSLMGTLTNHRILLMTKRILLLAFLADSVALMIGEILFSKTLILCTKPLLMPLLAAWLWASMEGIKSRPLRWWWLLGLLCSTLGDTLLMFTGKSSGGLFFLMGLGAFLLAHGCYIAGIWGEMGGQRGFLHQKPALLLPALAYLVALLAWLWPDVPPAMRLPVAAYAAVLVTMAMSVLHWRSHLTHSIFTPLMAGALLFVLSDSLLAINKFGHSFEWSRVAVMATYIVGQWLMARGVAAHIQSQNHV